ncbi:ERF family protein [Streptomyces sp. NBC_01410]|uniref:ERF family protein n=1 Tax=Streptomyces sp. NBC_01410 TaxID=2903856 RepID=UPI00324ADC9F
MNDRTTLTPNLRVHEALACVMRDVVPVGKDQVNNSQRYRFRGIDDLMSAVAGPMRAHGVFILPEVIEKTSERHGEKMTTVRITMRYRVYGPSGDCLEATVPGEASDFADKATNKAMSAALKYFLLQVLMIPVDGRSIDDGDRDHPEPPAVTEPTAPQKPVQPTAAPEPDRLVEAAHNAMRAAIEATDAEELRGLYRQAAGHGLLGVPVRVPNAGEMPLAHVLSFHGERLAAGNPKAVAA